MDKLTVKSPLLVIAASKGELEVVKLLVSQKAVNSSKVKEALFYAEGWEVVKALLDSGCCNKLTYKRDDGSQGNVLMNNPYLCYFASDLVLAVIRGEHSLKLSLKECNTLVKESMEKMHREKLLIPFCQEVGKAGMDISPILTRMIDNICCGYNTVASIDFLLNYMTVGELFQRFDQGMDAFEGDGIDDFDDNYCPILKRLFEMGFRPSSPHSHESVIMMPEIVQLYDLLYSYNLPISTDHLTMAVSYAIDQNKHKSEDEDGLNITRHLVKLGVSVTDKDKKGDSALSLAIKANYKLLLDILIQDGYNQEMWRDKFKARFQKFENYLNNNMDFSSRSLNDTRKAHKRAYLAEVMAEFRDKHPIQSVTNCNIVKGLKEMAIKCMPNW